MSTGSDAQVEQEPREKLLLYANQRNYHWSTQLKNYWVILYPEILSMNSTIGMNHQAWHQPVLKYPKKGIVGLVSKFLSVGGEEGKPRNFR
jgi:hypothetical protein